MVVRMHFLLFDFIFLHECEGPAVFNLEVFCLLGRVENNTLGFGVLRLLQETIIHIRN